MVPDLYLSNARSRCLGVMVWAISRGKASEFWAISHGKGEWMLDTHIDKRINIELKLLVDLVLELHIQRLFDLGEAAVTWAVFSRI